MTDFLIYLLQSSTVFSFLYLIYRGLLSKLTFHKVNRYVLLLLLPISILLPFTDALTPKLPNAIIQFPLSDELIFDQNVMTSATITKAIKTTPYNKTNILLLIYCLGGILVLLKLILSIRKIVVLKKQAKVDVLDGYKLIFTDVPTVFSIFNWIFISNKQPQDGIDIIISHEKAHISYWS